MNQSIVSTATSCLAGPSRLNHVGAVVADIQLAQADLASFFGIQHWDTAPGESKFARVAVSQLGPVQLELVQPLGGGSAYEEHLATKGEGLHHLGFAVPDIRQWTGELAKLGVAVGEKQSRGGDRAAICTVAANGARVVFEFIEDVHGRVAGEEDAQRPRIGQIGLVVADLDGAIGELGRFFDVNPWLVIDSDAARAGLAQCGAVQLEVIQPLSGGTIYHDHLQHKGEGLHHLAFTVSDFYQRVGTLRERGVGLLYTDEKDNRASYAYVDTTKSAGIIFEFRNATPGLQRFDAYISNLGKEPHA